MYHAILKMKTSNACGFDQMSSRILKMIPQMSALWLTHLTNCMLRKGKFPTILKISKITPIKKPMKPANQMTSYRPICNLNSFEKAIE